jgi:hypothetical protein
MGTMRHRPFPDRLARPRVQPAGFNLAAAFAISFPLVVLSHIVGLPTSWAVALIALVVALCSTGATWPASLGVAVTGWLFVTGFVINSLGELHVTGFSDVWRLMLLIGVAVLSTAASRRGVPTGRHFCLIGPAWPSASTVVAQPARHDPTAGASAVPPRETATHG